MKYKVFLEKCRSTSLLVPTLYVPVRRGVAQNHAVLCQDLKPIAKELSEIKQTSKFIKYTTTRRQARKIRVAVFFEKRSVITKIKHILYL